MSDPYRSHTGTIARTVEKCYCCRGSIPAEPEHTVYAMFPFIVRSSDKCVVREGRPAPPFGLRERTEKEQRNPNPDYVFAAQPNPQPSRHAFSGGGGGATHDAKKDAEVSEQLARMQERIDELERKQATNDKKGPPRVGMH